MCRYFKFHWNSFSRYGDDKTNVWLKEFFEFIFRLFSLLIYFSNNHTPKQYPTGTIAASAGACAPFANYLENNVYVSIQLVTALVSDEHRDTFKRLQMHDF